MTTSPESRPIPARLSPRWFAYKVPRVLSRRLRAVVRIARDLALGGYDVAGDTGVPGHFMDPRPVVRSLTPQSLGALAAAAHEVLENRFDLLGSGLVSLDYGVARDGFRGVRYTPGTGGPPDLRAASARISKTVGSLVSDSHRPIDWQVDFRSGFRWSERMHSLCIPIGEGKGADIKVPWELGKLQHLPMLALARGAAAEGLDGFCEPAEYDRRFRDTVLDFIARNPPGFGVHWYPAMLPAIRGANLGIAFDLFRAAGARFDAAFEQLLGASLESHAERTIEGLEWWDFDLRNNHYLANIAGLCVTCAYLAPGPTNDSRLAFASGELRREVLHQFGGDGGYFEGSTAYHAFGLEMATWALGFCRAAEAAGRVLGAYDPRPLPRDVRHRLRNRASTSASWEAVTERLVRARAFLVDTAPGDRLIQIGDNDSGRFVCPLPRYRAEPGPATLVPDLLDYSGVLAAAGALESASHAVHGHDPEFVLVSQLFEDSGSDLASGADRPLESPTTRIAARVSPAQAAKGRPETASGDPASGDPAAGASVTGDPAAWEETVGALPADRTSSAILRFEASFEDSWVRAYSEFGLWVYGGPDWRMTIRCGPRVVRSDGGHMHDDQLAVALCHRGVMLIEDPGSYTYTADPVVRNQLRGRRAHFVPEIEGAASGSTGEGSVWSRLPHAPAEALAWDRLRFVGSRSGAEGTIHRMVRRVREGIEVVDFTMQGPGRPGDVAARLQALSRRGTSAGYGVWVDSD